MTGEGEGGSLTQIHTPGTQIHEEWNKVPLMAAISNP